MEFMGWLERIKYKFGCMLNTLSITIIELNDIMAISLTYLPYRGIAKDSFKFMFHRSCETGFFSYQF